MIKPIDFVAPLAFFVALAWKSLGVATVTDTPIISNVIPINITKINIKIAKKIFNLDTPFDEIYETIPDNTNVNKNDSITHFRGDSSWFVSLTSFSLP